MLDTVRFDEELTFAAQLARAKEVSATRCEAASTARHVEAIVLPNAERGRTRRWLPESAVGAGRDEDARALGIPWHSECECLHAVSRARVVDGRLKMAAWRRPHPDDRVANAVRCSRESGCGGFLGRDAWASVIAGPTRRRRSAPNHDDDRAAPGPHRCATKPCSSRATTSRVVPRWRATAAASYGATRPTRAQENELREALSVIAEMHLLQLRHEPVHQRR